MVVRELDIIHILKTIHKLKAGLAAVIQNNKHTMKLTRDMYLNHTTIFSDTSDEHKYFVHNKFTDFLKVDKCEDTVIQGVKSDIQFMMRQLFVKCHCKDQILCHDTVN